MFERYTEKARRIIFFGRYEASQFGSKYIEPEHLLLGLLREDKSLAHHFLKTPAAIESIRDQIAARALAGPAGSTSVDLPLSHESKRILAYAAEEAARLKHRHIGPEHLLLGILRQSNCLAAIMLAERQVGIEAARAFAAESQSDSGRAFVEFRAKPAEPPSLLLTFLSEREKAGDITVATNAIVAGQSADIVLYEGIGAATDGDPLTAAEAAAPSSPAQEIAALRARIRIAVKGMENAIANHEFETARVYCVEERQLRENLKQLREGVSEAVADESCAASAPFLCILLADDESLSTLRARIEALFAGGVAHVWLLDQAGKRVYTATTGDGLREVTGDILRVAHPSVEIEWKPMFG